MADKILIQDLLLRTIIGINPEERLNRQDVLINVVLYADSHAAGASDAIVDAVNYRSIAKHIIGLVEGAQFNLVEKMAADIASICLEDPRVERVTVRVEKPGAVRFARSVGVEIDRARDGRGLNRAFVSLGSNIAPERNLTSAVRLLAEQCRLLAVSRVYETQPVLSGSAPARARATGAAVVAVSASGQPNFLNAAVLVETHLEAAEFKRQVLQPIESQLGRVRTPDKNAPRTIDLDISMFNDEVFDMGGRHIPDPDLLRFPHIAYPLADLAPQYCHPETGATLLEIARSLAEIGLTYRPDLVLWPV